MQASRSIPRVRKSFQHIQGVYLVQSVLRATVQDLFQLEYGRDLIRNCL